jgi:hypothetical protein
VRDFEIQEGSFEAIEQRLIIEIEIRVRRITIVALEQDRQAVDRDPSRQYHIAHERDRRTHVVDGFAAQPLRFRSQITDNRTLVDMNRSEQV